MRAPRFWYSNGSPLSILLQPLACIYGLIQRQRFQSVTPQKVNVPVICVGNLTVGGTGKTPVTLMLGDLLAQHGKTVFFLTRGYGGSLTGPVRVGADHDAAQVGDEALLLSDRYPTIVARDRLRGAELAIAQGAQVIVMDDGFQNPALQKDISIIVVDGETGFGNERLLPAGPLREPVAGGIARAHAVVVMGDDRRGMAAGLGASLPCVRGRLEVMGGNDLRGKRVIAFAGIGRPEKFFDMLRGMGCDIVRTVAFDDHHAYSQDEIRSLIDQASLVEAILVTTEKDRVRIAPNLQRDIAVVKVQAVCEPPEPLTALLRKKGVL